MIMLRVYNSPDSIRMITTFVKGELGLNMCPCPTLLRIFQIRYTIKAEKQFVCGYINNRGRKIVPVVIMFVASVKQSPVLMNGTRWLELRSWPDVSVASISIVMTPQADGHVKRVTSINCTINLPVVPSHSKIGRTTTGQLRL